jgi:hypothetical protein
MSMASAFATSPHAPEETQGIPEAKPVPSADLRKALRERLAGGIVQKSQEGPREVEPPVFPPREPADETLAAILVSHDVQIGIDGLLSDEANPRPALHLRRRRSRGAVEIERIELEGKHHVSAVEMLRRPEPHDLSRLIEKDRIGGESGRPGRSEQVAGGERPQARRRPSAPHRSIDRTPWKRGPWNMISLVQILRSLTSTFARSPELELAAGGGSDIAPRAPPSSTMGAAPRRRTLVDLHLHHEPVISTQVQ